MAASGEAERVGTALRNKSQKKKILQETQTGCRWHRFIHHGPHTNPRLAKIQHNRAQTETWPPTTPKITNETTTKKIESRMKRARIPAARLFKTTPDQGNRHTPSPATGRHPHTNARPHGRQHRKKNRPLKTSKINIPAKKKKKKRPK